MFTKGHQEAWAEPPSFLIGLGSLPASQRASNWLTGGEEWGRTVHELEMKHQPFQGFHRLFHMREGETNVRINMRPHVGLEGLFGPHF